MTIGPTIDGEFMPRNPKTMSIDGEVNKVPVMVGCLSEEGLISVIPVLLGMEGFEKPVVNKTALSDYMYTFVKNMDELILDTTSLLYITPEEVTSLNAWHSCFHIEH